MAPRQIQVIRRDLGSRPLAIPASPKPKRESPTSISENDIAYSPRASSAVIVADNLVNVKFKNANSESRISNLESPKTLIYYSSF